MSKNKSNNKTEQNGDKRTVELLSSGRLDAVLTLSLADEELTRSAVRRWFDEGRVMRNGQVLRPSLKVEPGFTVEVLLPPPPSSDYSSEPIPLDICYEDEWLLVINKPQGMVVHPAPGHRSGTLVNALLAYLGKSLSDLNGPARPGIVHRLDKDTSGLLLVAKDNLTHRLLAEALADHLIDRHYEAVVCGRIAEPSATVSASIGRDPTNRQRMAVVLEGGKPAVTHFEVKERFDRYTYIRVALETGRTHQIRVHMKYIGHPVLGDPLYGPPDREFGIKEQVLHAQTLHFTHPRTGQELTLQAPLPTSFQALLERLRTAV